MILQPTRIITNSDNTFCKHWHLDYCASRSSKLTERVTDHNKIMMNG